MKLYEVHEGTILKHDWAPHRVIQEVLHHSFVKHHHHHNHNEGGHRSDSRGEDLRHLHSRGDGDDKRISYRDIRGIWTPEPERALLVRRSGCVIMCIYPVYAIILHDRVFLFNSDLCNKSDDLLQKLAAKTAAPPPKIPPPSSGSESQRPSFKPLQSAATTADGLELTDSAAPLEKVPPVTGADTESSSDSDQTYESSSSGLSDAKSGGIPDFLSLDAKALKMREKIAKKLAKSWQLMAASRQLSRIEAARMPVTALANIPRDSSASLGTPDRRKTSFFTARGSSLHHQDSLNTQPKHSQTDPAQRTRRSTSALEDECPPLPKSKSSDGLVLGGGKRQAPNLASRIKRSVKSSLRRRRTERVEVGEEGEWEGGGGERSISSASLALRGGWSRALHLSRGKSVAGLVEEGGVGVSSSSSAAAHSTRPRLPEHRSSPFLTLPSIEESHREVRGLAEDLAASSGVQIESRVASQETVKEETGEGEEQSGEGRELQEEQPVSAFIEKEAPPALSANLASSFSPPRPSEGQGDSPEKDVQEHEEETHQGGVEDSNKAASPSPPPPAMNHSVSSCGSEGGSRHRRPRVVPLETAILEILVLAMLGDVAGEMASLRDRHEKLAYRLARRSHSVSAVDCEALGTLREPLACLEARLEASSRAVSEVLSDRKELWSMQLTLKRANPQMLDSDGLITKKARRWMREAGIESAPMSLAHVLEFADGELSQNRLKVRRVARTVGNVETGMQLRLAVARNRLVFFELGAALVGIVFGVAGLVTGFLGMNVSLGGVEHDENAVYVVGGSLAAHTPDPERRKAATTFPVGVEQFQKGKGKGNGGAADSAGGGAAPAGPGGRTNLKPKEAAADANAEKAGGKLPPPEKVITPGEESYRPLYIHLQHKRLIVGPSAA
uniref:Uncharacterized protein n=1 Tax=Chromera velia CCMP2878 TaxID=1169474 RepID=A0A0G4GI55_9ALVE|eukprot:Cvel_21990.t1-p1 / transcript=Cvel_21990.t1 / gene=Cvel_21990 / organism=Chromera_velia_CCMP2878 / gene_product=hypothetical protein / transcript_product=hypothetical protein / location=Cvel_scaffold2118:8009-13354(-) / protein_length=899 / sequence_SO=supercontig / SO=protein_coding / is_pseudo=false